MFKKSIYYYACFSNCGTKVELPESVVSNFLNEANEERRLKEIYKWDYSIF